MYIFYLSLGLFLLKDEILFAMYSYYILFNFILIVLWKCVRYDNEYGCSIGESWIISWRQNGLNMPIQQIEEM